MSTQQWTNERGNKVTDRFIVDGDRYAFDFDICTSEKGWKQYDTDQDAWYFGVWVHLEKRQVITYAEGDHIVVDCPTVESFKAELDHMESVYGPPPPAFKVIDAETGTLTEFYDERPKVRA